MQKPTKALLRKIRFIEHLAALAGRRRISALQMAVAIRLVSLFNEGKGYAYPTLDSLAADVGLAGGSGKRSVIRAINALVEKDLLEVRRGGGRGHANEYVPAFHRVPDGCPFKAQRVAGLSLLDEKPACAERVTTRAERVTVRAVKGDRGVTPSVLSSDLPTIRSLPNAAPDGAALVSNLDLMRICRQGIETEHQAFQIERAIKGGALDQLSQDDRLELADALQNLGIDHDSQSGHPIGGLLMRLSEAVFDHVDLDADGIPRCLGEEGAEEGAS